MGAWQSQSLPVHGQIMRRCRSLCLWASSRLERAKWPMHEQPPGCRITGSADLFAAHWEEGWPGSLATPRQPACGLNGASLLSQSTLTHTVATLLPAPAEAHMPAELQRLRHTLAKTLLMAVLLMQVGLSNHCHVSSLDFRHFCESCSSCSMAAVSGMHQLDFGVLGLLPCPCR